MNYNLSRMTAVVLAGGRGTRLAALHPATPKPMIPVAGKPFLHWLTGWLAAQGIRNFVFSTGYRGEQIEAWLRQAPLMQNMQWRAVRETAPLGTGGGVRGCLHLCGDNVLAVNADSLTIMDLADAASRLSDASVDGVIVGKPMADASRYGSLTTGEDDFLTRFGEKRAGRGLVNTGIYFFRKNLLEAFPAGQNLSMEYDVIPALIASKARLFVHAVPPDTPFLDIGTPESVAEADDFVLRCLANLTAEGRRA